MDGQNRGPVHLAAPPTVRLEKTNRRVERIGALFKKKKEEEKTGKKGCTPITGPITFNRDSFKWKKQRRQKRLISGGQNNLASDWLTPHLLVFVLRLPAESAVCHPSEGE